MTAVIAGDSIKPFLGHFQYIGAENLEAWLKARYIHCWASTQSRCLISFWFLSEVPVTVAAVSSQWPLAHVINALRNITTEWMTHSVQLLIWTFRYNLTSWISELIRLSVKTSSCESSRCSAVHLLTWRGSSRTTARSCTFPGKSKSTLWKKYYLISNTEWLNYLLQHGIILPGRA